MMARDDVLASFSRFARRSLWWPETEDAQIAALLALADRDGAEGWALIPTGDETAAFLARHHEALSQRLVVTVPPWEVTRIAYDKRLSYQLAAAVGVDHPATFHPRTEADLLELDLTFPVILKPTVAKMLNRFTVAKAWRADDRETLLTRYREACSLVDAEVVAVQELIPGGGEAQFSFAALSLEGRTCASVVARRTRQYPADFGRASTFVETIHEPSVGEAASKLIAALNFTGLIEVEFKRDVRDGRLKLLDMNPRVWGWHTLCGRAGVDFPHLLWRMHQGESIRCAPAQIGVRWRRLSTDLPTSLSEIAHRRLSARAYLRSLRYPRESAILARDDPLPGLLEAPLIARMLVRRLLRRQGM